MGRKKKQKSYSIGPETNADSTSIGPSFTTFIIPIADPYDQLLLLQPMLQELGKQNPQLLRMIQEHNAEFLQLINEPLDGSEG
jgi:hypothetical protein